MTNSKPFLNSVNLLDDLAKLISVTHQKAIATDPDMYIVDNINFLSKSFVVIMCIYLETYLKDAISLVIEETNKKLKKVSIPHNLVRWGLDPKKEFSDKDYLFKPFEIKIDAKSIDDNISGNFWRTRATFSKIGIKLDNNPNYLNYENRVSTIIAKRNNIVHYNDDASDMSFNDIVTQIKFIQEYMLTIDTEIIKHIGI